MWRNIGPLGSFFHSGCACPLSGTEPLTWQDDIARVDGTGEYGSDEAISALLKRLAPEAKLALSPKNRRPNCSPTPFPIFPCGWGGR